jgi:chemotaxis protein histidine kinase CheA
MEEFLAQFKKEESAQQFKENFEKAKQYATIAEEKALRAKEEARRKLEQQKEEARRKAEQEKEAKRKAERQKEEARRKAEQEKEEARKKEEKENEEARKKEEEVRKKAEEEKEEARRKEEEARKAQLEKEKPFSATQGTVGSTFGATPGTTGATFGAVSGSAGSIFGATQASTGGLFGSRQGSGVFGFGSSGLGSKTGSSSSFSSIGSDIKGSKPDDSSAPVNFTVGPTSVIGSGTTQASTNLVTSVPKPDSVTDNKNVFGGFTFSNKPVVKATDKEDKSGQPAKKESETKGGKPNPFSSFSFTSGSSSVFGSSTTQEVYFM